MDGEVREWDAAIELAVDAARAEEGRVAELGGVWGWRGRMAMGESRVGEMDR